MGGFDRSRPALRNALRDAKQGIATIRALIIGILMLSAGTSAASAFTWGCGDFGLSVRAAAKDGWTKADSQALMPRYEDLSAALRERAVGVTDEACVRQTLAAWNRLGAQMRTPGGKVAAALDGTQSVAEGCDALN